MANIWMDARERNENHGQPPAHNAKQFMSARKHSSKKQVFGELKNVMHNLGDATPFKENLKKPMALMSASKPSMCVDVLRKQQMKENFSNAQQQLEKKMRFKEKPETQVAVKFAIAEDAPWDDLEIPLKACDGKCGNSLKDIFDDTNMIDDAFLLKVIHDDRPDSDNEEDKEYPQEVADTEDFSQMDYNIDIFTTQYFASVEDSFKFNAFKLDLQNLDLSF